MGQSIDNNNCAKNTAVYVFGLTKLKVHQSKNILENYHPTCLVLNHKFIDTVGITGEG